MKFNKIKKIIYVLFFAFLFLINKNDLLAIDYEGAKKNIECLNNETCALACGYNNNGGDVNLFIYGDSSYWQMSSTHGIVGGATSVKLAPDALADDHIHFEKTTVKNNLLNSGKCPTEAYILTYVVSNSVKEDFCFGSKEYCEKKPDGKTSKLLGPLSIKDSITPDVDTMEKNLLSKLPGEGVTCESARQRPEGSLRDVYDAIGINIPAGDINPEIEFGVNVPPIYNFQIKADKRIKQAYEDCAKSAKEKCEKITDKEEREKCVELENGRDDIISRLTPSFSLDYDSNVGTCDEILGQNLKTFFGIVYTGFKIAAPVLTALLGMLDFTKASSSPDADKDMKAAFQKLVKRVVIIIVIFALPLFLSILKSIWPTLDLTCII